MSAPDTNPTQGFKATDRQLADWSTEEPYWRSNWQARPYAKADLGYEYYQPGYRYGTESAYRLRDRNWKWDEAEPELRSGWDKYEHRGQSTWENVKDAVKDAWHRVTT
jgi:hypothetical protein